MLETISFQIFKFVTLKEDCNKNKLIPVLVLCSIKFHQCATKILVRLLKLILLSDSKPILDILKAEVQHRTAYTIGFRYNVKMYYM